MYRVTTMKILQRYVASSYLSAFLLGMIVLSFVLSVGLLVKATELVVKGLSPRLVLQFLAVSVPESFTFTIPLSALVSALLVFGRLSADGEINAMKSCGINLWSVMLPPAVFGLLMSGLCMFVNNEISPRSHQARRNMSAMAGADAGLKLLEPGHFIQDFPDMTFWFARREGDVLHDLIIFDRSQAGRNREIRAERAKVIVQGRDLLLEMQQVRVEPFSDTQPGAATATRLTHIIPDALRPRRYKRDSEDFRFREMVSHIRATEAELHEVTSALRSNESTSDGNAEVKEESTADFSDKEMELLHRDKVIELSQLRTELHRRFALAMATFAFVMLGMPLGIRAQRRESTIGIAISLGVTLLYYVLLIGVDSLSKLPEWRPHLLVWFPSILCLGLSVGLIRRNQ